MYDYLRHCLVSLQNPVELLDRFVEERGEVGHQSGVSRTCERTSQDDLLCHGVTGQSGGLEVGQQSHERHHGSE